MKKFIEDILKNKTFLDVLFNFSSFYHNSDYANHMSDFYTHTDKKIQFISKNTEWLFINDEGFCYGILDKFVVKVDSEGQFSYVCHGFENLAPYLLQDNLNLSTAKYYCEQKNTTLTQVFFNYEQLLKKNSISIKVIINENEFNDFIIHQ